MIMTTELIKELVWLAVEKGVRFEYEPSLNIFLFYIDGGIEVHLDFKNTPAQLQTAIYKVKAL